MNSFIQCIIVHKPEEGYKWSHHFQNIHPYIKTMEVFNSWEDALKYVDDDNKVDLVVGSYELTDVFPLIFDRFDRTIPVVFTSIKPFITEKALQLNCLDFINESADMARLRKCFDKFQLLYGEVDNPRLSSSTNEQLTSIPSQKSRFLVRSGDRFSYKEPHDVAFFLAEDGQTFIIEMVTGKKYLINHKLMDLENEHIDPKEFFRINRSIILNVHAIGQIQKYLNSRLKIELKVDYPAEIIVSREKVTKFKRWVNQ
ncbi:LytR/AlgR family response regulator transcription factor [Anditalea andensis]|uniref:LytR family transcriptional regulator n=1 Tax=Anditalea andensis TaxID=1048983 RepID=A0A074KZG8_9BACT|nr:LytTR family DNA-binding domain-containing protein [Anditalea andensis]KEO73590.1 LytR family transcriptional regulator [Anditalea andensis]